MAKRLGITILVLCTLPKMALGSQDIGEIWRNNRAVEHMGQKKVLEAHDEFTQLLTGKPYHPLFQYNMGFSFLAIEEPDKAIKMYEEVLKLEPLPPEIEFPAHYNLGVLYGSKGEIDKALASYQSALEFVPDSKEVKTNIELLFQQKQGGGKGDKQNKDQQKQDNKDGEGENKEPQEFTNKPQQPNQFDNQQMSKSDVNKILEELKKQEQRIRAKHERKNSKRRADRDKNW